MTYDEDEDLIDEEEFPPLGKSGSMCNPDIHIKWICDGAVTLSEVAEMLRGYAEYCQELEAKGWQLSCPVDNSHGEVEWIKTTPPVTGDCHIVGCVDHEVKVQSGLYP